MSDGLAKTSCVRCGRNHDTPQAFLIVCCRCGRSWHHTCHIPPVTEDEILRRLGAEEEQRYADGIRAWQCRRCSKKVRGTGGQDNIVSSETQSAPAATAPNVSTPSQADAHAAVPSNPRTKASSSVSQPLLLDSAPITRDVRDGHTRPFDSTQSPWVMRTSAPGRPVGRVSFTGAKIAAGSSQSERRSVGMADDNSRRQRAELKLTAKTTISNASTARPEKEIASEPLSVPNLQKDDSAHNRNFGLQPVPTAYRSHSSSSTSSAITTSHPQRRPISGSVNADASSRSHSPWGSALMSPMSSSTPSTADSPPTTPAIPLTNGRPDFRTLISDMRASGKLRPPPSVDYLLHDDDAGPSNYRHDSPMLIEYPDNRVTRTLSEDLEAVERKLDVMDVDPHDIEDLYATPAPAPHAGGAPDIADHPPLPSKTHYFYFARQEEQFAGKDKGDRDDLDRIIANVKRREEERYDNHIRAPRKSLPKKLDRKARKLREAKAFNFIKRKSFFLDRDIDTETRRMGEGRVL